MNKLFFEGNWEIIKAKLKQKWAELTEDELLRIKANNQEIYGVIEAKYGKTKEEIVKELDEMTEEKE